MHNEVENNAPIHTSCSPGFLYSFIEYDGKNMIIILFGIDSKAF